MAMIIGGLMVIGLGLSMGAALLRWLGIELHYPARIAAPLLLAALETLLFLLAIPGSALVAESWHWPLTGGLIAAAWLINGGVGGLYWYQHRPPREAPQPDQ
ncbi:hypothetical protein [Alcanivorax sp.]|uniref:hypothetical protein n=1 Tax=Alcanivorax sp. TaxID=1872427 RepID=UPI0025BD30A4|nr:hypothetical protein [Alcanivorax sp.]